MKGFITPRPLTIIEQFKTLGHKPGVAVKRGADGARYMFIITSNSYRDREREYITTRALERYVEKSWFANDVCQPNNVHLLWHDGDPIGDIVWADMQGPFLIEVSKERSNQLIQLSKEHKAYIRDVWDYIEAHPEENWGASHGFQYEEKRINPAKDEAIYDEINKFETSTLPLENAANALTFSGVIMDKDRNALLDKMLGTAGAAEELRKGVQGIEKKLDAQGVEHKSIEKPDETVVKGLIDTIQAKTDAYISALVDNAPAGLSAQVAQMVISALAGAVAEEPTDEPADEAAAEGEAAGQPSMAMMALKPDAVKVDMTKGQVKLLDTLIKSQEDLATAQDEIAAKVKALEPLNSLAEVIKTLNSKIDSMAADLRNVKAQGAGRSRAASADNDTIVTDKKMVEKATEQLATFDPFWGVNRAPKEQ